MHTLFPVHFPYCFHPGAAIRSQLSAFQPIFLINKHLLWESSLWSPLAEITLQTCSTLFWPFQTAVIQILFFLILFLRRSNYNLTCCNCCQVIGTKKKKKGKTSIIYRVGTKRTAFLLLLPVAAFHSQHGGRPLWVWQMLSPTSACSVSPEALSQGE